VRVFRSVTPALALLASFIGKPSLASPSSEELVRQAREHEAAKEDDIAARRYTEALTLDARDSSAWLGLGELRLRTGEPREAERVYTAALARLPSLASALEGRARALWTLGRRLDAEDDLGRYAEATRDPGAYRRLAEWLGAEGRIPAELAVWRYLRVVFADSDDTVAEARRMIRALTRIVDCADPASSPFDPDPTRLALARIARRGL
jgi:tetratricopeptide (TPR) repeat protein